MNSNALISSALFLFGFYHFAVGLPAIMSFSLLKKIGSLLYKLKIPTHPDPQFEYVLKPLGLYALTVSSISFLALFRWELTSQQDILKIFALLLFGRGLCRLYYSRLFLKAFGTTPARNKGNALLTFVIGSIFIFLSL